MQFLSSLRATADSRPDAVALSFEGTQFSYAELETAVAEQAQALSGQAVRRGTRVVLIADNSPEYLITAFAIWVLGAVLVTVYPSSEVSEFRYVLERAEPELVLADERAAARLGPLADEYRIRRLEAGAPSEGRRLRFDSAACAEYELALICFTSGSTAHPKAVMHSRAGLSNGAAAYARVWHLGPGDRTIVCLPMAWAFGLVTTSMAALSGGGRVIILKRTRPALLIDALTQQAGTFFAGVTTTFVKLVDYLSSLPETPAFSGLRLCISGGEPRNEPAFARWTALSGVPVHDVYAASECFPAVTYDPVEDPAPLTGSAGKVAPGAQMRVVDEHGDDVPAGSAGEALWKSPAHFLGYWRDPDTTTAATTPDGWYRTKDLVRVDEDGYVHVLGRLSDMIIRGGSNVSPAEVEAVLSQHPAVAAAAVVGLDDPTYGQQVVAAVIPSGDSFDAQALQAWAASWLAGYKVPARIIIVPELPVNDRTGKVDRRRLAAALTALA